MKLLNKIFGTLNKSKIKTMLIAAPVTLAYPVIKALTAEKNKLTVFSDTLLIISLILILAGVVATFARFGDFDITRYVFVRSIDKNTKKFGEYKKDRDEQRSETFNYSLFFGLIYLAVSIIIALVFC
ncbi:MAG: DUF3899 domain-containing protein [Clostridia bacterium]|nr:DUF3899 domain-containing protein [Clostridia bacterium]